MADKSDSKWRLVHEVILDRAYDVTTFFNAVKIWIERPQVLNRRLVGSYVLQSFQTTKREELLSSVFAMSEDCGPISREELLRFQSDYEDIITNDTSSQENGLLIEIRTLLPRESSKYKNVSEVVIQDKMNKSVIFTPFEEDELTDRLFSKIELAYQVSLHTNSDNHQSLNLSVLAERKIGDGITCPTVQWLKSCLLPKLQKWMAEDGTNSKSFGPSLQLVPVHKYTQKYEELKKKYKHFVKMWPERTDPYKFVYEDVAIATYLLLLWESELDNVNEQKSGKAQTFVDLGCGNGLLVHILANEGHFGKGIDLRARKVWKFFDDKTDLQVCSLDPSSLTFSDVDWIIGNHSDELTPWIPVIAARSSYNCKYFVLPCCFHDFYCKFQRESSSDSQYCSYLNYVQNIGKTCGFQVQQDVLRIPSTKKVCQIGQFRKCLPIQHETIEQDITKMLQNTRYCAAKEESKIVDVEKQHPINSEQLHNTCDNCELPVGLKDNETTTRESSKCFVPRPNKEVVKNCTQLDKKLLGNIVQKVATELLSRAGNEGTVELRKDSGVRTWNKGGCMELREVSALFDQKVLNELRSEAGGIKTVLRNSHQVFKVCNGVVEIRNWQEESHAVVGSCTSKKNEKRKQNGTKTHWKTKQCWFHANHPDGCPLAAQECSFAHGNEDVKTLRFKSEQEG